MLNIKARGKTVFTQKENQFIYGFYTEYETEEDFFSLIVDKVGCVTQVDPKTVGRYAGTTKGGQEVYEGSILKQDNFIGIVKWADGKQSYDHHGGYYPIGFVVEWPESHWRNDLGFWLNEREVEVIGDIHSNPELLEGIL